MSLEGSFAFTAVLAARRTLDGGAAEWCGIEREVAIRRASYPEACRLPGPDGVRLVHRWDGDRFWRPVRTASGDVTSATMARLLTGEDGPWPGNPFAAPDGRCPRSLPPASEGDAVRDGYLLSAVGGLRLVHDVLHEVAPAPCAILSLVVKGPWNDLSVTFGPPDSAPARSQCFGLDRYDALLRCARAVPGVRPGGLDGLASLRPRLLLSSPWTKPAPTLPSFEGLRNLKDLPVLVREALEQAGRQDAWDGAAAAERLGRLEGMLARLADGDDPLAAHAARRALIEVALPLARARTDMAWFRPPASSPGPSLRSVACRLVQALDQAEAAAASRDVRAAAEAYGRVDIAHEALASEIGRRSRPFRGVRLDRTDLADLADIA